MNFVEGSNGDTVALGNGAGDVVNLSGQSNTVVLGNGDVFNGQFGSFNTITVGNGNDTIHVGMGDTVTVGKGHDTFIFDQTTPASIGSVTINHFDPNKDVIQIASALTEAVTPVDNHGNAVITVDPGGDTITLTNVQTAHPSREQLPHRLGQWPKRKRPRSKGVARGAESCSDRTPEGRLCSHGISRAARSKNAHHACCCGMGAGLHEQEKGRRRSERPYQPLITKAPRSSGLFHLLAP